MRRFPISDPQTIARATHWRVQWKFGAVISIIDSDSDAVVQPGARSSSIPSRFRFEFVGELRFRFQIIIISKSGAFL